MKEEKKSLFFSAARYAMVIERVDVAMRALETGVPEDEVKSVVGLDAFQTMKLREMIDEFLHDNKYDDDAAFVEYSNGMYQLMRDYIGEKTDEGD